MINTVANASLYTKTNFYSASQKTYNQAKFTLGEEEEKVNTNNSNYTSYIWQMSFVSNYALRNSKAVNDYKAFLVKNAY
ncbi:MAG: hypothetical protein MJ231_00885 [bacterium]|nr:hypothetical protein [bacterium]